MSLVGLSLGVFCRRSEEACVLLVFCFGGSLNTRKPLQSAQQEGECLLEHVRILLCCCPPQEELEKRGEQVVLQTGRDEAKLIRESGSRNLQESSLKAVQQSQVWAQWGLHELQS